MRNVRFAQGRERFAMQQEFGRVVRDSGMCGYVGHRRDEDGWPIFRVSLVSCGVLRCGTKGEGRGVDQPAYVVQRGGGRLGRSDNLRKSLISVTAGAKGSSSRTTDGTTDVSRPLDRCIC